MESTSSSLPIAKVLYVLYPEMDAENVTGPVKVLSEAYHDPKDPSTKAFEIVYVSATPTVTTIKGGVEFKSTASYDEVKPRLAEFDVLIVPGGDVDPILKAKGQPLQLIKAFSDVQVKYPNKERTVFAIGTASILLAQQGLLAGLSATTHPDYFIKFENVCAMVAQRDLSPRVDVLEERYVVNNLRFELGNEDENPYIRRKSDGRRPSNARKGSNAWKESNTRHESNARRASLLLGGLRVITSGENIAGVDATLYLVSIIVSVENAEQVAENLGHEWVKGVVVDGVDV